VTGWQEIKIGRLVENFVLVGWLVCLCYFRFIILGVFFFILQNNISKLTAVVIKTRSSGQSHFKSVL